MTTSSRKKVLFNKLVVLLVGFIAQLDGFFFYRRYFQWLNYCPKSYHMEMMIIMSLLKSFFLSQIRPFTTFTVALRRCYCKTNQQYHNLKHIVGFHRFEFVGIQLLIVLSCHIITFTISNKNEMSLDYHSIFSICNLKCN